MFGLWGFYLIRHVWIFAANGARFEGGGGKDMSTKVSFGISFPSIYSKKKHKVLLCLKSPFPLYLHAPSLLPCWGKLVSSSSADRNSISRCSKKNAKKAAFA